MKLDSRAVRRSFLGLAASAAALAAASPALAGQCEDLAKLNLPNVTIKSAEPVAAGAFVGPGKTKRPDLPAICRVVASVHNAPDSDIGVEVWLPVEHWNGVFHGVGNGGFAGSLSTGYGGMEAGVRRGYAAATTDTGTAPATGLNGDPLIGHPQKWKDWGLLSTHVMTVTGKAIAKAFYGAPVKRAYYTGCSTGGQQGLIEAQYYPEDYNGILIGAPVVSRTWGHAMAVWDYQAANLQPGHVLSDAKLGVLHKAVLSTCGAKGNGLAADPFLADPSICRFDPATLACGETASDSCLTPAEIETAKAFYSGPLNHAGKPTYYGWPLGSEAPGFSGWRFTEQSPGGEPAFDGLFKWVFGAGWDWRKFDFDRDMPKVQAELGPSVDGAVRGDVSRFRARGGKLVIFQGWADTLVAPDQTLAFYDGLGRKFGGTTKVQSFARLFMAPGVMHCGGGAGPNAFDSANDPMPKPPTGTAEDDLFVAMTRWVEEGKAPVRIIATKYVDDSPAKGVAMQRPLCAYPQKAWYKGAGPTSDAKSFTCAVAKPKAAG